MAYVQLVSTTTGVGNLEITVVQGTLVTSSVLNSMEYHISHRQGTEYEIGTGHCPNATTLIRDTITSSSNDNLLVNLSAGFKDITNDDPPIGGEFVAQLDPRYVNVTGDTMTGNLGITKSTPELTMTASGTSGAVVTVSSNDLTRWHYYLSEGTNGNLNFYRFNDAGVSPVSGLLINRTTGAMTLTGALNVTGAATLSSTLNVTGAITSSTGSIRSDNTTRYTPGSGVDTAGLVTSGSYGGGITLIDGAWRASIYTSSGNLAFATSNDTTPGTKLTLQNDNNHQLTGSLTISGALSAGATTISGDTSHASNRINFSYAGSSPASGPAVKWSDGGNSNVIGLYINSGLVFQGCSGNTNFRVTNPTTNGTMGGVTFNVDGVTGNTSISGTLGVTGILTASGRINQSSSGFQVGPAPDNIYNRVDSGFYENSTGTTGEGWPTNNGWHHLIACTHSNQSNYYSTQICATFAGAQNTLYWRTVDNAGNWAWRSLWDNYNFSPGNYFAKSGDTVTTGGGWAGIFLNNTDQHGIYVRSAGYAGIGVGVLRYDGAAWMHQLNCNGDAYHSGRVDVGGSVYSANGRLWGTNDFAKTDFQPAGSYAPASSRNGFTCGDINSYGIYTNGGEVNCGQAKSYGTKTRTGWSGAHTQNSFNFDWRVNYMIGYIDDSDLGGVMMTSDYRVKRDVIELPSTWDAVKKLKPISFKYKDWVPPNSKTGEKLFVDSDIVHWGFFAHELQETLTEGASSGVKDDPVCVQSPNDLVVIAALTKTLQEAMARIEQLEAQRS